MEVKIIEDKVKRILNDLNIRMNLRGYICWIEAVKYIILNNRINYKITIEIYKELAKKIGTTPSGYERALTYSLRDRKEEIQRYFNVDYSIKNSTFLALLVDKVKGEIEDYGKYEL